MSLTDSTLWLYSNGVLVYGYCLQRMWVRSHSIMMYIYKFESKTVTQQCCWLQNKLCGIYFYASLSVIVDLKEPVLVEQMYTITEITGR